MKKKYTKPSFKEKKIRSKFLTFDNRMTDSADILLMEGYLLASGGGGCDCDPSCSSGNNGTDTCKC